MGKKITRIFLGLMMIFLFKSEALAAENTYEIKEAEMTLKIPEEFIVFQRIVSEFDPNLELINSSKEKLEDVFKKGNIYLNAVMVPTDYEIVVTLTENANSQELFNFTYFSDKELDNLGSKLINDAKIESSDIQYRGYETYKTDKECFLVFDLVQSTLDKEVYGKQYYTIVNGQVIYITLHSYVGEIGEDKAQMLKSIVDSMEFKEIKEKPEEDFFTKLQKKLSLEFLLTLGAVATVGGIILIVVALRKSSEDYEEDYDEEAIDIYEEDYGKDIEEDYQEGYENYYGADSEKAPEGIYERDDYHKEEFHEKKINIK